MNRLVVIATHPIQYHVPVYRALERDFRVPVSVIFGSDFSVAGYWDEEFQSRVAWDTDLLSGYEPIFLSRGREGGALSPEEVSTTRLFPVLRRLAPAAVLLTGLHSEFYRSACFQALRLGIPVLFRGETTDHTRRRGFLLQMGRDGWLRWLYGKCRALLYIGTHSQRHYQRLHIPDHKLFFSPYCVDTSPLQAQEEKRDTLRCQARQEIKAKAGEMILLFSGKLSDRKGVDLLLPAVHRLSGVPKNLSILFLGDGALRNALEAQAKKFPATQVRFLGFKNQTQLSPYYHAADMLVLPSRHSETWGLVVNEALHHGVPCVVSDAVGCAPDLVDSGKTGAVFRTGSLTALSEAIVQTMPLTGRPEIRAFCRQKMEAYSVKRAAEGIAEAFTQGGKSTVEGAPR